MRPSTLIVGTLLASLVLAAAPPVLAHDFSKAEPWTMSDEELEAAGWQYGESSRQSGSLWGGILATTVGTVVHGTGHLYAGDTRTGTALLISEGVSLGLIAGGLLTETLSDSDGGLAPLYRPLTAIGAGLFITSWLLDVVGTFKGTRQSLPQRASTLDRLGLSLGYSHHVNSGLPLRHALSMKFELDFGWLYLGPRGQIGLDQDYLSLGAATGIRFGYGRRPYSYLDLQLEGDEVIVDDPGYAYESLVISVGLSLDLGDLFAHLDGLVYQNRLGFGTQLFRFAFDGSSPLNADNTVSLLVVQSNLNARLLPRMILDIGYIQRPDILVSNLSQAIGAFFVTLTYELPARMEWFLDGRVGTGIQIVSGISFNMWR